MLTPNSPTSWLDRIVQSLTGLILGPLCIIGGLFLLYFVESSTNYGALARKATVINATTQTDFSEDMPFVALSGVIKVATPISDNLFLKPSPYLSFSRTTEIFAWKETSNTKTPSGDSQNPTPETTISYSTDWTTRPTPTELFKNPVGHENPTHIPISPAHHTQESFLIGALQIKTDKLHLPQSTQLILSEQTVNTPAPTIIHENSLFTPKNIPASPLAPKVGDLKTTYHVVDANNKEATLFCAINQKKIKPALLSEITQKASTESFFRLFWGSAQDAINELQKEYDQKLFWGQVITFIIFFFGFLMFLGPISAIVSGISLLSGLFDTIISVLSLVAAAITFFVAKLLIQIFLSPLLIGLLCCSLLIIAGLVVAFIKKKTE